LIGLTATPYRNKEDEGIRALKRIFNEILIPKESFPYLDDNNPVRSLKTFLQQSEILSIEEIQIIPTKIKLKLDEKGAFDDIYAKKLGDSALRHKRREFIVDHILEILNECSDALVIYFGPTVEDAKIISSMLRMEGAKSAFIGDKLNLNVREEIINDFKQKKIQILTNCRILTAGFDAPKITHVVLGWPTDSTILFHQIIGRGLRGTRFGGTQRCFIKIFTDEIEDLKDHQFAHVKYFDEWEK
jgi:superfamily II DNA or RNA helicase